MLARATIALFALLAVRARAQQASIFVDVAPTDDPEEIEKRYTPELIEELDSAKADALLLYTEFSARASQSLKHFIRNVSRLRDEAKRGLDPGLLDAAPSDCRGKFETGVKKAEHNAHRAATFSGENHHKFFLAHMIVFRMHLNKSEEYVKKCDRVISRCGIKCETTPRVKRWRNLAAGELHRVLDDLQHSRRMYRDLLTHAQRRLNTIRRRAAVEVSHIASELRVCCNTYRRKRDGNYLEFKDERD